MPFDEKETPMSLPTAEELHHQNEENTSDALTQLLALFDDGTFTELCSFVKRCPAEAENDIAAPPEGVICGYGSVDGALVFAFAQDSTRLDGAVDTRHAEKIEALYAAALRAAAPVVGIFDSRGADIRAGISGLAAYGRIAAAVTRASGKIPQIAVILGECRGLLSAIASTFDFLIEDKNTNFGTDDKDAPPLWAYSSDSRFGGTSYARELLSYLPSNAETGVIPQESADSLNRRIVPPEDSEDTKALLTALADNGMLLEVFPSFAKEVITVFTVLGGVKCGIIASAPAVNKGRLTPSGVEKMTRFVGFCGRFGIPVISLVHSAGLVSPTSGGASFSEVLGRFMNEYTAAAVPKITVITGKAIGASDILFGSRSFGADLVYALETAEIGPLPTASAVAFAWNDRISAAVSRDSLEKEWRVRLSSPLAAAAIGEVDDIIALPEMRKRLASALLMLAMDGTALYRKRKAGTP